MDLLRGIYDEIVEWLRDRRAERKRRRVKTVKVDDLWDKRTRGDDQQLRSGDGSWW